MIDEKRLLEIDARSRATSAEPWWTEDDPKEDHLAVIFDGRGTCVACVAVFGDPGDGVVEYDEANAEFAAHAHADVPDLVAEVWRLREELTTLKAHARDLPEQTVEKTLIARVRDECAGHDCSDCVELTDANKEPCKTCWHCHAGYPCKFRTH